MGTKIELKWTIPNAISLLRILLVPVFAVLYLMGLQPEQEALQYWALGVLVLSGLTDCVDGYIARRFDQITDLGKILDPIADKLTQMTVLVCVVVHYHHLLPLLIVCVCKEVGQCIGSAIMLHRGAKVEGAKWYGKLTTIVFYVVMAAFVLWEDMPMPLMLALGTLVAALMLFAFIRYAQLFVRTSKAIDRQQKTGDAKE